MSVDKISVGVDRSGGDVRGVVDVTGVPVRKLETTLRTEGMDAGDVYLERSGGRTYLVTRSTDSPGPTAVR